MTQSKIGMTSAFEEKRKKGQEKKGGNLGR
jgi:hypothetical protein